MKIDNKIKCIIEKMTHLFLTKGVQPSEITDAIFAQEYNDISFSKTEKFITMVVCFSEVDEENMDPIIHRMKYTYTLDKYLVKIEQKIGTKNYKTQWDRDIEISKLLHQFTDQVKIIAPNANLNEILSTMPEPLQPSLCSHLKLVA
jgi:phage-related protein